VVQLNALGKSAWLSGHAHLFTDEEIAFVKAAIGDEAFHPSWEILSVAITVVAHDRPHFVGSSSLRAVVRPGDYGLVEPMMVLPDRQRRGIGQELWKAMVLWTKMHRYQGLRAWALDGNKIAMNFYRDAIGCREVDKGTFRIATNVQPATGFQYDF
jgi:GNAT superfamily N-acetyltransferase